MIWTTLYLHVDLDRIFNRIQYVVCVVSGQTYYMAY